MAPRIVNMALGIWMMSSAFLWPHSWTQKSIALVFGLLASTFALAGAYSGGLRYINVMIGGFFIAFGLFVPSARAATAWNELVVGVFLIAAALVRGQGVDLGSREPDRPRRRA